MKRWCYLVTVLIVFFVASSNSLYAWTMDYTILEQYGLSVTSADGGSFGVTGGICADTGKIFEEVRTEYVYTEAYLDLNFIVSSDYANGPDTVSLYLCAMAYRCFPGMSCSGEGTVRWDYGMSYTINGEEYNSGDQGSIITLSTDTVYNLTLKMFVESYASLSGLTDAPDDVAWVENDLVLRASPFFYPSSEDSAPVPEPATVALLITGLVGFFGVRKKRKS